MRGDSERLQTALDVNGTARSVQPFGRAYPEGRNGRGKCGDTSAGNKELGSAILAQKGEKMRHSYLLGFRFQCLNLVLNDGKLCYLIEE